MSKINLIYMSIRFDFTQRFWISKENGGARGLFARK